MRYIILLFFLSLIATSQAQPTFNKRYQVACNESIWTGIEVTDSCYYVVGIAQDMVHCIPKGIFLKLDTFGNVLSYTMDTTLSQQYKFRRSQLVTDIDGTLLASGEVFDSNGYASILVRYNAQGTVLSTQTYKDQQAPQLYIQTEAMAIAKDSSYLLIGQTNNSYTNSYQILQIERDGTIRWNKTFGYNGNFCLSHSIVPLSDGFVVGYANTDLNQTPINYTVLCQIKKMDYNGSVLWEWQNDSSIQINGANDLIQTKDKGWVVATAIGKEILRTGGTSSVFVHDSYVFKLDSARNWLWGTPLRSHSYTEESKTIRVIELADSSLVTFGMTVDTFIINGTIIGQYDALIAKLSPSGDSLWGRRYHYFEQQWSSHEIFDVEQTPDGGFLACGEAKGTGQGVYKQGWLLKLDEHGCLVPGCHIDSSRIGILPIGAQPQAELKLYPNPATDYLNVLYRNQQIGEKLTFRILDEQGRVLKFYNTSDVSDKTYVFPVWELLSGWYVLEVRQDSLSRGFGGKLIGSEVFIKQ
ncbi:MAG: T9SS type A sorting domain-containing protein [Aureispira sp.]